MCNVSYACAYSNIPREKLFILLILPDVGNIIFLWYNKYNSISHSICLSQLSNHFFSTTNTHFRTKKKVNTTPI